MELGFCRRALSRGQRLADDDDQRGAGDRDDFMQRMEIEIDPVEYRRVGDRHFAADVAEQRSADGDDDREALHFADLKF